jgi:signal transduction histidine kinase
VPEARRGDAADDVRGEDLARLRDVAQLLGDDHRRPVELVPAAHRLTAVDADAQRQAILGAGRRSLHMELAYRVVQEGVTNALRHAAGAPIRVTVQGERDAVSVEVVNAAASARSGLAGAGTGTGLRGLRERAGAHGGRVAAGLTPDGGWRLHAAVPRG